MMEYLTSSEAAALWGIGKCRVNRLAREGRIAGAVLFGKIWMIPKGTRKPLDGRTLPAKEGKKTDFFRFPLFVNSPADSFSPPLTVEELLLRNAQLDYYACRFDEARKTFDELAKSSESIPIRIMSLFYLCSLSIEVYGGENFKLFTGQLQLAFGEDFPHKKDMSIVTPWLYMIMVQFQSVSDKLNVDPLYDYSPTVQPLIACLSFYHLSENYSSKSADGRLDVYEILCRQLQQHGHYYEACELHFLLFLAYYVAKKDEEMLHHLKQALTLVRKYDFYIIAASYEFYYHDAFQIAFREFPEDFTKRIQHESDRISISIAAFSKTYHITDMYSAMSKEDYRYLMFAFQGNSNKSVARELHISERTVASHYADLYEKLGVKGKQELIELCTRSLQKK